MLALRRGWGAAALTACILTSCVLFRPASAAFVRASAEDVDALRSTLAKGIKPPPGPDIALTVNQTRTALTGLAFGSGARWRFVHTVDSIALTQDAVLVVGDGELVSLDVASGEVRFRRSIGPLSLVGASGDGALSAVVLRAQPSRTSLLALNRNGSVLQQWEANVEFGTPAVFGPYIWVAWDDGHGKHLSAVDPVSGGEVAQTSKLPGVRDALTNWRGLWVGDRYFQTLDSAPASAPSLQGLDSALVAPLMEARPRDAQNVRLPYLYAALPRVEETWATRDNTHYMTGPSTLVALRTSDRAIRWATVLPSDALDAAAVDGGLFACLRDGSILHVSLAGKTSTAFPAREPVAQCVIRVSRGLGAEPPPEPGLLGYAEILRNARADWRGLQEQLLQALRARSDHASAALLLELSLDPVLVRAYGRTLREALMQVRDKESIEQFFRQPSFADHVPVGELALAAAALRLKSVAPRLTDMIEAEATPETERVKIARALESLSGQEERKRLSTYFAKNYAGAKTEPTADVLIAIAKILFELRSMSDYILLRRAEADAETSQPLREFLTTEFAKLPPSNGASSGFRKVP